MKLFPIHSGVKNKLEAIPWEMLAPHEAQAFRNHDQTLNELAQRGGLSYVEALCAMKNSRLPFSQGWPSESEAEEILIQMIVAFSQYEDDKRYLPMEAK